jgi:beta-lactamase family protein
VRRVAAVAVVVLAALVWPSGETAPQRAWPGSADAAASPPPPRSARAAPTPRWRPDIAAAARYARSRAGEVSFAVRTSRRLDGRGLDRRFNSASVIKAMLMITYLRQSHVRRRALTGTDRALLEPMIRSSDNDTASAVRDLVGNDAVTRLARRAGMTHFAMNVVWGLSQITARDQTRLFLKLEQLLPARHRAYGLRLLRTIVPWQRWGMGRVVPRGWRLYFKGGWGAGTGAVSHQVGLLQRGDHRVAIAVLTHGSPSHAYSTATLEGVVRRLVRGLGPRLRGTAGPARAFLPARPREDATP